MENDGSVRIISAGIRDPAFTWVVTSWTGGSFQSQPTMSAATSEVQKHRSGFSELVPPDSVGSIVARDGIVFEPL